MSSEEEIANAAATQAAAQQPSGDVPFALGLGAAAADARYAGTGVIGGLRGAATGAVVNAAATRIADALSGGDPRVIEAADLASTVATAIRSPFGSMVAAVLVTNSMLQAGIHAMETSQRMTKNIAAAHAFGYWVGLGQGWPRPLSPPSGMVEGWQTEDNALEYRGRTRRIHTMHSRGWVMAVHETLTRMSQIGEHYSMCDALMQRFPQTNRAWLLQMDKPQLQQLWRLNVVLPGFGNDASKAAAVFLAARITHEPIVERRATAAVYRRYPYRR